MPMLNLADMFTAEELTAAVDKLPLVPRRLAPLFGARGVRTTSVGLDMINGAIVMVENQDRSAPPQRLAGRGKKRSKISLACAHLPQSDIIHPDEVQDLRAFGSDQPETVESVVNDRMTRLKNNVDATLEYHRMGAVKGVILDADGTTVLHDLYDVFEVDKKEISFVVPANAPERNNPILNLILQGKRHAEDKMGATPIARFEAMVGSDFYDYLTGHKLVRGAYEMWQANQQNWGQNDYRSRGFTYGGVTWFEYSVKLGGNPMVAADEAHMYPVASGMFQTYHAPANWGSTTNTIGREFYAQIEQIPMDRGWEIEVQSNPLCVCTYPEALVTYKLDLS